MPLLNGYSKSSVRKNVKFLLKEGKPHRQVYAIVMSVARRTAKKRKARFTKAMESRVKEGFQEAVRGTGSASRLGRVRKKVFAGRKAAAGRKISGSKRYRVEVRFSRHVPPKRQKEIVRALRRQDGFSEERGYYLVRSTLKTKDEAQRTVNRLLWLGKIRTLSYRVRSA